MGYPPPLSRSVSFPAFPLLRKRGCAFRSSPFRSLFFFGGMLRRRFFAFVVRKSDCFCKFAQLYADEKSDIRPCRARRAVLCLLERGGGAAPAAGEAGLLSRIVPRPGARRGVGGRQGGPAAVLFPFGQHGLPLYRDLLCSRAGEPCGGNLLVEGDDHLPGPTSSPIRTSPTAPFRSIRTIRCWSRPTSRRG